MTQRATDDKCNHLCDALQEHLARDERTTKAISDMSKSIKCLHNSMELYKPSLQELEKMLPRLDELLTRFSQAKGIFWFLAVAGVSLAALAGAFDWVVSHVKRML